MMAPKGSIHIHIHIHHAHLPRLLVDYPLLDLLIIIIIIIIRFKIKTLKE